MISPHRWAALLLALLGCEPETATQVLVHFDAEELSAARATGMRLQVLDTSGAVKLDQTLRFGEGNPPAELPVTLPLVPRGQDASRTFAVLASLLDGDEPFSSQRVTGGYAAGELVHVYVLFEDACVDLPACAGQETCREGVCADACVSPSPSRCPRDSTPCGECTVPSDGGCAPAPEGSSCTSGTCRIGACCTGCWDGTECQPGGAPAACGIAGSGCFSCACPAHDCVAGACAVPRTARFLAAGGHVTCAIDPDGALSCWGENTAGVLVTGDFDNRNDPVLVGGTWEQAALGWQHACAIDASGVLHCWGENDDGETGIGAVSAEPVAEPTRVGDDRWKRVGLGDDHTCAVRDDGSLFCWGLGARGQLGQGNTMSRSAPTQVGTETSWTDVRAGNATTCGLLADGRIFCFGANFWGQIGRNDTMNALAPVQPNGARTYSAIAGGGFHFCAIASGGGLWCWGRNTSGQSGGATTADRVLVPTRVGTETDWVQLTAGELHTCGIRADGSLWCWGENGNGQLGQGNSTDLNAPARVGSDTDWAAVAAGARHTCALRTNGTVWCFGRNDVGQLGTRNHVVYRRPRASCLPL